MSTKTHIIWFIVSVVSTILFYTFQWWYTSYTVYFTLDDKSSFVGTLQQINDQTKFLNGTILFTDDDDSNNDNTKKTATTLQLQGPINTKTRNIDLLAIVGGTGRYAGAFHRSITFIRGTNNNTGDTNLIEAKFGVPFFFGF